MLFLTQFKKLAIVLTKHHFKTSCFLKKELNRNIIQEDSPFHCCFYCAELCFMVALSGGKYWAGLIGFIY